eukprot:5692783-Prymnesium_polylepis.1
MNLSEKELAGMSPGRCRSDPLTPSPITYVAPAQVMAANSDTNYKVYKIAWQFSSNESPNSVAVTSHSAPA